MKRVAGSINDGRADAVYLDGARVQFTHRRCGHIWVVDLAKAPVARRMQSSGAQLMARWWSVKNGGCIIACPKCQRVAKRIAKEPKP